jgi:hypothetical protein
MMKVWMRDPNSGGVKIKPEVQERITKRILRHAEKNYAGKYLRLGIRYKGAFCYIDAFVEPPKPSPQMLKNRGETLEKYYERMRNFPLHLCRLRYFGDDDKWSLAFYTYSHEAYQLCVFHSGNFYGTPEEGFDVGATYLHDR